MMEARLSVAYPLKRGATAFSAKRIAAPAQPVFGEISFRSDQMDIPVLDLPPRPHKAMMALSQSVTRTHLYVNQKIKKLEFQGTEKIKEAVESGKHIILALNHPGFGDVYITPQLSGITGKPCAIIGQIGMFYAIKGPRLAKEWLQPAMNWVLSSVGIFPVHGDVKDNNAQKTAIDVVEQGKNPFIILPEGHYTWQNDRITDLQYGAASIGLTAAGRLRQKHQQGEIPEQKEVVIIPIVVKHRFLTNVLPGLQKAVSELEKKLEIQSLENPQEPTVQNLIPRIHAAWLKLLNDSEATLLKDEKEIGNPNLSFGKTLEQRHNQVIQNLISSVERAMNIKPESGSSVAIRIKNIRQYHRLLRSMPGVLSDEDKKRFDEVYKPRLRVAYEFHKFSTDYLDAKATPERLAETIFKLNYIITDEESNLMPDLGSRKTILKAGLSHFPSLVLGHVALKTDKGLAWNTVQIPWQKW